MKRIMLAWEMGANFGHLARLVPLALKLRERGDEVLFVIRDLRHASQFLVEQGLGFVSAPVPAVERTSAPKFLPISYADILALEGMSNTETLEPQVAAWSTMFKLFKPDAIVLDHAPLAMFAAQMEGLPRVAVGTGFELPPLAQSFPLFRVASPQRRAALLQLEKQMLQTFNRLAAKYGRMPFERIADIFRGTARCFVTLPELDHYGERKNVDYVGLMPPWRSANQAAPAAWPDGRNKILVYLQPSYPSINRVLRLLDESGHAVIACVPGASPNGDAYRNIRVASSPFDTEILLPQADLVIFHGGHGMIGQALTAGKPMLTLPQHIEQGLMARRIEALGVGKTLSPQRAAMELPEAIESLLGEKSHLDAAKALARRLAAARQHDALAHVMAKIAEIA